MSKGGDPLADDTPNILLRCIVTTDGGSLKGEPLSLPLRRLSCDPKEFWTGWRQEILPLCADWRVAVKELVLPAHVKSRCGLQEASILLDTGAKIPLAFRS